MTAQQTMTYEEYLDEVTTLITEKYKVGDAAAIKLVVTAQDAEYFVDHDDVPAMRTTDRAHEDARAIYQASEQASKQANKQLRKPASKTVAVKKAVVKKSP